MIDDRQKLAEFVRAKLAGENPPVPPPSGPPSRDHEAEMKAAIRERMMKAGWKPREQISAEAYARQAEQDAKRTIPAQGDEAMLRHVREKIAEAAARWGQPATQPVAADDGGGAALTEAELAAFDALPAALRRKVIENEPAAVRTWMAVQVAMETGTPLSEIDEDEDQEEDQEEDDE